MSAICVTCLSRNRKLFPVKKINQWLNVFCCEIQTLLHLSEENDLCWECKSKIINMALFLDQASRAQQLLEEIYMGKTHATLSKLSVFSLPPVSFDENLEEGHSKFYENSFPLSTDNLDDNLTIKQENIDEDDSTVSLETATHSQVQAETTSEDNKYHNTALENLNFELNNPKIKQDVTESTDTDDESEYSVFTHKLNVKVPNTLGSLLELYVAKDPNDKSKVIQVTDNKKSYEVPIAETIQMTCLKNNTNKCGMWAGTPAIQQTDCSAQKTVPPVSLQIGDKERNMITMDSIVREQIGDAAEKMYKIKTLTDVELEQERREEMKRIANFKYKCELCVLTFKHELFLIHHMKKHENSYPYLCKVCEQKFLLKVSLDHHVQVHYRRYECRSCNYMADEAKAVIKHYEKEHREKQKPKECPDCGAKFATASTFYYHYRLSHKKTHSCDECGKKCITRCGLGRHKLQHEPKKQCPQCGRAVKDLESHLRFHAEQVKRDPDYCAECNITFKSPYSYKSHLKFSARHRQPDTPKVPCPQCDKKFINKTQLKFHTIALHTKNYPFHCDYCGKGCVRKSKLKYHILEKHEGSSRPKNKICHFCGKAFAASEMLINHVRTHTGEKPFHCDLCPWRFATKTTLVTHMRGKHPEVSGGFKNKGNVVKKTDKTVHKKDKVFEKQDKVAKKQDKLVKKQD